MSDTQTLDGAGIRNGDMIAVHVERVQQQPARRNEPVRGAPQPVDAQIEALRRGVMADPQARAQLARQAPDMAAAINDAARFKELWLQQGDNRRRVEEYNEMHSLDDEVNEENQGKIADLIRRQAIQKDIDEVMEENPERGFRNHSIF